MLKTVSGKRELILIIIINLILNCVQIILRSNLCYKLILYIYMLCGNITLMLLSIISYFFKVSNNVN